MNSRNSQIDIMRGIAIISIVIGHACNTEHFSDSFVDGIQKFVYIYHLSIFFFCSGVMFKNRNLLDYLKRKIRSIYIPFVICNLASFLVLPALYYLDVVEQLSITSIITRIGRTLLFLQGGIYTAPTWFCLFFFLANVLFFFLFNLFSNKSSTLFAVVCWCIGGMGVLLVKYDLLHIAGFNRAMVMEPIIWLGYVLRRRIEGQLIVDKKYAFIGILISSLVILLINSCSGLQIELSKMELYGFWGFFPMSMIGIFFVICLSNFMVDIAIANKAFSYFGRISFTIMATHQLVFKIIDGVYEITTHTPVKEGQLYYSVVSFPNLRIIYILGSLLFAIYTEWMISKFKARLSRGRPNELTTQTL